MKNVLSVIVAIFFLFSSSIFSKTDTLRVGGEIYTFVKADTTSRVETVKDSTGGTYIIKKGDCLWTLSGKFLNDPLKWKQVYKMNPFLLQPGRMFVKNGKIIVIIKPGEQLLGLEKVGWSKEGVVVINNYYKHAISDFLLWFPFFLLLLALVLAYFIIRYARRSATSTSSPRTNSSAAPQHFTVVSKETEKKTDDSKYIVVDDSHRKGNATEEKHSAQIQEQVTESKNNAASEQPKETAAEKIYTIGNKTYTVPKGGMIEIRTETITLM